MTTNNYVFERFMFGEVGHSLHSKINSGDISVNAFAREVWNAAQAECASEIAAEITQLKAHINALREALEHMVEGNVPEYDIANYKKLLTKKPAQSLIEHDAELIERCANDLDRQGFNHAADAIRALKGNHV